MELLRKVPKGRQCLEGHVLGGDAQFFRTLIPAASKTSTSYLGMVELETLACSSLELT